MKCPKCGNPPSCKDGKIQGKQRYLCRGCRYRYTVEQKVGAVDRAVKRQAVHLYLEGLGFRSIGRLLKFSHVAVHNWIKECGQTLETLKSDTPVEVMEMDEMHSFIGSKKTLAGFGSLWIVMERNSSATSWGLAGSKQAKNFGVRSATLPKVT